MSTPAINVAAAINSSAPGNEVDDGKQQEPSFTEQVNQAIKDATKDEKGNLILPEGLPEHVANAAMSEKRRRDTQTALANSTTQAAALEAENAELKKLLQKQGSSLQLTPEQQTELDELKFKDPDAWRARVNQLEQEAANATETTLSEIASNAQLAGATGARKVILDAFLAENPGLKIDDDVLQNDIPPRINSRLASGDIGFTEYLAEVAAYLKANKVVEINEPDTTVNLSDVPGGSEPSAEDEQGQAVDDYENLVF